MHIIVVKDQNEAALKAFNIFKEELLKGSTVFGLATGSTPITTYNKLINSNLDFSYCTSINLDEYIGLSRNDLRSYHYYMYIHLFKYKKFKNSYIPNGTNKNQELEISRYNNVIAQNPIDLQLLGLGVNGHIGFNEPGTSFKSETHVVHLTSSTIEANSRFFDNKNDVPKYAYSMGISSIMKSKHILLEAYGNKKAKAVKEMINGPITTEVPASILQDHPNTTILLDEKSASLI